MQGLTAVAGRRALSAGTLLVFGGGLVLYQVTSLMLGPAASREFHLSLMIPTVDQDELSEPMTSSVNLVIGTLVGPASVSSISVRSTDWDRLAGPVAIHRPAAPKPGPVKVGSQPPAISSHPIAPIAGPTDASSNERQGDHAD